MATLKQGSTGSDVTSLQKKLNSLGYSLSEDGIYGSKTAAAVRDYQSKNGLATDGIVGSKTTASLYGGGSSSGGSGSSPSYGPGATSTSVTKTTTKKTYSPAYDVDDYTPSQRVTDYEDRLSDYEDNEPDPFVSRYDDTINEILNTIKNKGSFDLSSDANYQQLYDNYKESYTNSAKKAMRDTLASANAATGGYGSTYGQVAAQQAYDSQMEGLNDQNLNLMQMAYQMYGDDVANDYNKLGAFQGQDAVDYNRYRDTYNDWYNNRNYYANQYQNAYTNDYGQYRDRVSDARNAYQDMESTYANAMSYASQGYELPSYLKEQLGDDDLSYFENVAAQAQLAATQAASAGSRGSSSSGRSSGKGTSKGSDYNSILAEAMAQPTLAAAKAYIENAVDEGLDPDEALQMYESIENMVGGGAGAADISAYPTPKNYSEYVAYTGDNSVLTQKEFNERKQGESAGYDSYTDYLAYRWEQFKRSYGISIK